MNQPADNRGLQEFDDEIFSTLRDVEMFLSDLSNQSLQLRQVQKRDELLETVVELRRKLRDHRDSQMLMNGNKSPRPKRKSFPCAVLKDSMHSYVAHLQKTSVNGKLKPPGSPEIQRSVDKPQMRPRSVSCPDIRLTLSHSWRTSLPKVPENDELTVDCDEGS
ncbi:uncharacterized protein [Montipora capricornis]|uniref:uncharacterized protein n=1 Tax=Montipora foliosa TaxID=591990 RepID=UPI0035F21B14